MPRMRWRRGSAPDPAEGAHNAPPDPLVGWGGAHPLGRGTPRPQEPHPSRRPSAPRSLRLRRSELGAFGASFLAYTHLYF